MAAAATVVDRGAFGDLFSRIVDVTLDSSYPAGGYPLASKDLGFGQNGVVFFVDGSGYSKTGGWAAGWDYTNGKLQIFDASGAANAAGHEVIATTVLTGVVVRLLCLGKGQG
jgi:hypothetical protein